MANATGSRRISERTVQRKCVKWARDNGWLALKVTVTSHRGWPDYLFIKNGRYLWVEFKRPGQVPTELQLIRITTLRGAHCNVAWADDLFYFMRAISMAEQR